MLNIVIILKIIDFLQFFFVFSKLLDQATGKLQLRSAARRFYTQDGTLILDVQDLIDWCLNFYKKENHKIDSSKIL